MKISLITVSYNAASVIRTAIESVLSQRGVDIEYLVIDGGSADGTAEILREYEARLKSEGAAESRGNSFTFRWISERDRGMYDAMNKGISLSTGEVIGILNADDALAADDVLSRVAEAFVADPKLDGSYGDIRFVNDEATVGTVADLRMLPTSRYCSGRFFRPWMFRFGVQTAHPSTFFRRSCFDRFGLYSLDYGMFGDFELLCRFIWKNRVRMRYLKLCTTVMRAGGASTNGLATTIKINRTDRRALRDNGCRTNYLFLYARYIFKIWGCIRLPSRPSTRSVALGGMAL